MSLPLTPQGVVELYGSLMRVLVEVPAQEIGTIAGTAGFDLGLIPDGLDEHGFARRPQILSGINGQWNTWSQSRRAAVLPRLAEELVRFLTARGRAHKVDDAILKNGFCFRNGGFVPVDAAGAIAK